jgi:hypothetical protein
MSSMIKTLVAVALVALTVSCTWIGSRTEASLPQTWQIPLSIQLSLSKSSKLKAGESITAFPRFLSHHPLRGRCPLHLRNAVFSYSHRSPCLWEGTPQTWETL